MIPTQDLRLNVGLCPRDEATSEGAKSPAAHLPLLESADAGDFDRKDAFSFGAWIKIHEAGLSGSVMARMDDQHGYRGWDLWIENNKVATHLVNQWPDNALKVATRGEIPMNAWTHVFVTYDGSSQAAGVKILRQRRAPGHRHRRRTS